jgi:ligand-binding SRPBCC domain-containing protein
MKVHAYKAVQFVPVGMDRCWEFFSSPSNLSTITPPEMGFRITSEPETKMYPGQIITYVVKPVMGIPVQWVTEITHVQEHSYFVDEQRSGPYALWHHKHFFREVEGGIEMTDLVHYALPFGVAGRIALPLVRSRLTQIFAFRRDKVAALFGA